MIFDILLMKGVGPIRLGQTRKQVREAASSPVREFRKTAKSVSLTDSFDELGIHVFYDRNDRCEAIELFEETNATFEGVEFFKMTPQEALAWFKQKDENLEVDKVGALSRKLGLGFYVDAGLDDPEGTVDTVLVCGDGYWD